MRVEPYAHRAEVMKWLEEIDHRHAMLEERVAALEAHFEYHDESFHEMMVEHGYHDGHRDEQAEPEPYPMEDD